MKSLKQGTTSTKKTLGIIFFSLIYVHGFSQSDFLKETWDKQVKPLENSYLNFDFSESSKQLHHSFYPWQETTYETTGEAWGGEGTFSKVDTLKSNQDVFLSKTQLTEDEFLLQNFGIEELVQVSPEQFMDQTYLTARYLPTRILNYFLNQKIPLDLEDDLVWIPKNGEIQTARERQAGLYHAILDLGIAVDTIIQSWPVLDYGVKTIIPFGDLKKSIESKK